MSLIRLVFVVWTLVLGSPICPTLENAAAWSSVAQANLAVQQNGPAQGTWQELVDQGWHGCVAISPGFI